MESYIEKKGYRLTENSFRECFVDLGQARHNSDYMKLYPQLAEWEEFQDYDGKYRNDHVTNNKVIKYIVAMYDPKSPFARDMMDNYEERKLCAADYASFEISDTGIFTEYAQEIMQGLNDTVNKMIIRYCILCHSLEFATYLRLQRQYYENTLANKDAKITDIDAALKVLNRHRDAIMAMDRTPSLVKSFYRVVKDAELEVKRYRPETFAQKMKTVIKSNGKQKTTVREAAENTGSGDTSKE